MYAAYVMRYLKVSLTEAMLENRRVAGRILVYSMQLAAQWDCENLRVRGLYAGDDCGNCVDPSPKMLKDARLCMDKGHRDQYSPYCAALKHDFVQEPNFCQDFENYVAPSDSAALLPADESRSSSVGGCLAFGAAVLVAAAATVSAVIARWTRRSGSIDTSREKLLEVEEGSA